MADLHRFIENTKPDIREKLAEWGIIDSESNEPPPSAPEGFEVRDAASANWLVKRHLDYEPITARPPGTWYQLLTECVWASASGRRRNVYRDLAEFTNAAAMHRQALSLRKRLLGDEHPDVAQSIDDMPQLDLAHVNRQGIDLIVVPLDRSFGTKAPAAQNAAIDEIQMRAQSAGLAGTVVPVWEVGSGGMAFIAPRQWHQFFQSIDWNWVSANINRELSW